VLVFLVWEELTEFVEFALQEQSQIPMETVQDVHQIKFYITENAFAQMASF
jgi:hypothetical protein